MNTPTLEMDLVYPGFINERKPWNGVNSEEKQEFYDILKKVGPCKKNENLLPALSSLSSYEIDVLRKVHGITKEKKLEEISIEGRYNLLREPDNYKDVNLDGFVDVGSNANTIVFPPADCPKYVKQSWGKLIEDMSPVEKTVVIMPFLELLVSKGMNYFAKGNPIETALSKMISSDKYNSNEYLIDNLKKFMELIEIGKNEQIEPNGTDQDDWWKTR